MPDLTLDQLKARLPQMAAAMRMAIGEEAVRLTQQQMLTGYSRPILRTGALRQSIRAQADGQGVRVGSSLPYAAPVHNGTAHMPGRPFLADAVQSGREALRRAAAEAVRRSL